ncbi:MAG: 3-deoxy-D-manno-octulosonic acid transferase [Magnetococcales bacterium]|nr:3-deoxy-D-manno-octulosonic acid transferase [Magnetococcales bacterium]
MYPLYTVSFFLLALVTLPWWLWQYVRGPKYRGTVRQRLGGAPSDWPPDPPDGPPPCFWLHAVSVGEAVAARDLARRLVERLPGLRLMVSTVTRTGRDEVLRTYPFAHGHFYLPLDLPGVVDRVLDRARPRCLVVMETELWPNLFRAAARRGIPVVVANGRLSPPSFRNYRRVRWAMARFLAPVRLFCMQSAADADRMTTLLGGADPRVMVTGNIKYDQALRLPDAAEMTELDRRLGPRAGPLWVAASTHRGEEEPLLAAFRALTAGHPALRLVLVPRHPERAREVAGFCRAAGWDWQFLGELDRGWSAPVLIVDQVGWLRRFYGLADLVFVGGSFIPHGGQNILEPAAWGRPPLHGPHMFNFREAERQLREAEASLPLAGPHELAAAGRRLLDDPALARAMGERARQVVAANTGALERTLAATLAALPAADGGDR